MVKITKLEIGLEVIPVLIERTMVFSFGLIASAGSLMNKFFIFIVAVSVISCSSSRLGQKIDSLENELYVLRFDVQIDFCIEILLKFHCSLKTKRIDF